MDDCYLTQLVEVNQNVDYLDNSIAYNKNTIRLLKCHRLTGDARIKNACWRRTLKNLHHLDEINPFQINWDKQSDVTYLYGPEIPSQDHHVVAAEDVPELDEDCALSVALLTCSWLLDDEYHKLLLKRADCPQPSRKRVLFDYKVTLREIINGYTFDYQFLDDHN